MNIVPIGYVTSPVIEGVDEGWGQVVSEITIEPALAEGLEGLDSFSHILVVFHMHHSTWDPETDLVRRPRGLPDMPLTGIFAQRAKHRPNAVGVTAVRLLGTSGNKLTVRGLDAVDGTPVIDVKPYFPQYDSVADPTCPGWVARLMEGYF